jgi:hypothetical protein
MDEMKNSTTPADPSHKQQGPLQARDHHEFAHALLFTGHMIDRPDREPPRFPAWAENAVRSAIGEAVAHYLGTIGDTAVGLAGGACGGDLLFHEVCQELDVPTRVLLALPPEDFIAASVAAAGQSWVDRFHRLLEHRGPQNVLVVPGDVPKSEADANGVWERANLWMIDQAIAAAPDQALLPLWDGSVGDGPGGTEHFIQVARRSGIRVLQPIPLNSILQP